MKMCDKETVSVSNRILGATVQGSFEGSAREILSERIKEKEQELHELRSLLGCLPSEIPCPAGAALLKLLYPR